MPIMRLNNEMNKVEPAQEMHAVAGDPAFELDVQAWCKRTGHELVDVSSDSGSITAVIRKR